MRRGETKAGRARSAAEEMPRPPCFGVREFFYHESSLSDVSKQRAEVLAKVVIMGVYDLCWKNIAMDSESVRELVSR